MDRLDRAYLLLEQHRYELAAKEAAEALRAAPDDDRCYSLLSHCFSQLKRWEEAEEAARTAIGMAPDWSHGYFALACVEAGREQFGEARETLNVALRIDPDNPDHWNLLSYTQRCCGHLAAALNAAEQGLARDPEHHRCRVNRAVALIDMGRAAEADQALVESLRNDPDSGVNHALRGVALLSRDLPEHALAHYQEALRLDPTNAAVRREVVHTARLNSAIFRRVADMAAGVRSVKARLWADAFIGFLVAAGGVAGVLALAVVDLIEIIGWTAQPLFTLPLMLRQRWRRYLTVDEIRAALVAGGWFLYGAVCVGLAIYWHSGAPLWGTFIAAFVSVPTVAVFECRRGWRRLLMAGFALLLVSSAFAVQAFVADGELLFGSLLLMCLVGTHCSGWLGCLLATQRD